MTLHRMLSSILVALALAACAQVAGAHDERGRVVVVADAAVPAAEVRAAVRAAGPGAELRLPRTLTEQLSVTHWFAARGYDVVAVGLSEAVAVDPVARRYPGVRFTLVPRS